MQVLLDSRALLWAVFEPQKLSVKAHQVIADENTIVYISMASLWEISIKQTIGRLSLPDNFFNSLMSGGFEIADITVDHISAYAELPLYHRDPFDRMLVAQAISEQLVLVTRDSEIAKYAVETLAA